MDDRDLVSNSILQFKDPPSFEEQTIPTEILETGVKAIDLIALI